MRKRTVSRLRKVGIYIHRGGFAYDATVNMFEKRPACMLWHKSEHPNRDEIKELGAIVEAWFKKFGILRIPEDFLEEGANTITFKKENGRWTFRKLTWKVGPMWYPKPGTLKEIKERAV